MWIIFCSTSGSTVVATAVSSGGAGGASDGGAGATGAGSGPGVLRREIGGRTAARLTAPSVSARFGFGFFSSISETVSTFRGAAAFGFGASTGFAGGAICGFAGGAGVFGGGCGSDLGLAGAWVTAGLETPFAGACAFAGFVSLGASFFFGSA